MPVFGGTRNKEREDERRIWKRARREPGWVGIPAYSAGTKLHETPRDRDKAPAGTRKGSVRKGRGVGNVRVTQKLSGQCQRDHPSQMCVSEVLAG
eukprot:204448-Rhodomonas_salina.1